MISLLCVCVSLAKPQVSLKQEFLLSLDHLQHLIISINPTPEAITE